MTRTMYDALVASRIPQGAQMAAWYPYDPRGDGPPRGAQQVLTIDNTGDHPDCDVLDYEPGAAWGTDVAERWLADHAGQGTIYSTVGNKPALSRPYYWWVALWDGRDQDVVAGSVAQQYQSTDAYDLSDVVDDSWYPVTVTPPGHRNIYTPVAVDGVFGPLTIKAEQFVSFHGVTADCDGEFGPQSKRSMQAYLGVAQDGIAGPVTVRALQKRVGVTQDGVWGPLTTEGLQRSLNAGTF
jgi:peptidoglycan hydrolase-like protein with peptidoglycan-binding domain